MRLLAIALMRNKSHVNFTLSALSAKGRRYPTIFRHKSIACEQARRISKNLIPLFQMIKTVNKTAK